MAPVVFDTNIFIDALKGYEEAINELVHWDDAYLSAMTWMEVFAGANEDEAQRFSDILRSTGVSIVPISESIMTDAAKICATGRQLGPKIRLADAIIKATAAQLGAVIITRNTKDFRGPNVRVPYELKIVTTTSVINVNPPGEDPRKGRRRSAKG